MGILLAGVLRIEGMSSEDGLGQRGRLISLPAGVLRAVFRLLPHILPVGGSVL